MYMFIRSISKAPYISYIFISLLSCTWLSHVCTQYLLIHVIFQEYKKAIDQSDDKVKLATQVHDLVRFIIMCWPKNRCTQHFLSGV